MNNSAEIITQNKPKLGFAGIGWIGRNRLNAIRKKQSGEIKAIVDPDSSVIRELQKEADQVFNYPSFEEMLDSDIDGVVIASPSALHAEQVLAALNKGKAVFCQKPLGKNAEEVTRMVETARQRNLLLGVDFSYRHTNALRKVRNVIHSGEIGQIYGINLVFHNAYGPDKSWYYDAQKSGGGCMMDLGIHLVDLLFWILDGPEISNLSSSMFCKGRLLKRKDHEVEDYAAAQFTLDSSTAVQLACSWNLPAGKDAVIEASFYGSEGGVSFHNLDGSFYHFRAEKFTGTSAKIIWEPPDSWEGRAAVRWSEKLAENHGFDQEIESIVRTAQTLDLIYQTRS